MGRVRVSDEDNDPGWILKVWGLKSYKFVGLPLRSSWHSLLCVQARDLEEKFEYTLSHFFSGSAQHNYLFQTISHYKFLYGCR